MIRKNTGENTVVLLEDISDDIFDQFVTNKNWTVVLDQLIRYESVRNSAIEQLESIHLLRFGTMLSQSVLRLIQSGKFNNFLCHQ